MTTHGPFKAYVTADAVNDLVRVRLLVEGEALRDSIAHGDDAWETAVVASAHALALVERRVGDGPRALDEEWSTRHRAFHLSLYAACTSDIMRDMVNVLFDRAEHYRRWAAKLGRRRGASTTSINKSWLRRLPARTTRPWNSCNGTSGEPVSSFARCSMANLPRGCSNDA